MAPVFVHVTSKNGTLYFAHAAPTLYFAHAVPQLLSLKVKFFIFSGNLLLLRESPFHVVNYLKSFDFKLFFLSMR